MAIATIVVAALAALTPLAQARQCANITIPLDLSARTATFNLTLPTTQVGISALALKLVQQSFNFPASVRTGYKQTTGTYNISGTFCQPSNSTGSSASPSNNGYLQIMSHGSGFDRTYFDLAFNNYNYSYVNAALAAGYSTFAYDRLGLGLSGRGDALNEIQATLEVESLLAITREFAAGTVPGLSGVAPFGNRVVQVGNGAGSTMALAVTATQPNLTSALVLTSFALNGTFGPLNTLALDFQDAAQNQPLRFGNASLADLQVFANFQPRGITLQELVAPLRLGFDDLPQPLNYPLGYLAWGDSHNLELAFTYPENIDRDILPYVELNGKQPVNIGSILTGGDVSINAKNFTGPVLVMNGVHDLLFCGGDCLATGGAAPSIPASVQKAVGSNGSNFQVYLQPDTAGALNLHKNATVGYQVITNFLKSHNLG